MKVYLDLVMFINFFLDFLLLLGVSIILKRNVSIKRVILGSFFGGISILILFIPMNNIMLFIFKLVISIIMRYSMSKINKQNIIETIRNDNI